jgi:hypothetical protein
MSNVPSRRSRRQRSDLPAERCGLPVLDTEGRARICGAPATTTRTVREVDFTACDACAANVDAQGPNDVTARRLAPAVAEPRRCVAGLVVDGVAKLCGEPATVEHPVPTGEGRPPQTMPFCAKHAPPHVEITDDEENDEEQAMGRKLRRAAKRGDL